jgi:DNA-binding response OmpR family regulator
VSESGLPKVLVVEDDRMLQRMIALQLRDTATVLSAHTLDEARNLFANNPDVRLVVLDGCLGSAFRVQIPDTLPLIPEMREIFHGPIIAASSFPSFREMMMGAGCDHHCVDKRGLSLEIRRLLEERAHFREEEG